jgi:hypothetical protein
MASWLASQLKAAENLLEAVDRTVSSAPLVGQRAWAPGDAGQYCNTGQLVYANALPGPFPTCRRCLCRSRATRTCVWRNQQLEAAAGRLLQWRTGGLAAVGHYSQSACQPAHDGSPSEICRAIDVIDDFMFDPICRLLQHHKQVLLRHMAAQWQQATPISLQGQQRLAAHSAV